MTGGIATLGDAMSCQAALEPVAWRVSEVSDPRSLGIVIMYASSPRAVLDLSSETCCEEIQVSFDFDMVVPPNLDDFQSLECLVEVEPRLS